jgi:hypothetical protein
MFHETRHLFSAKTEVIGSDSTVGGFDTQKIFVGTEVRPLTCSETSYGFFQCLFTQLGLRPVPVGDRTCPTSDKILFSDGRVQDRLTRQQGTRSRVDGSQQIESSAAAAVHRRRRYIAYTLCLNIFSPCSLFPPHL